MLQETLSLLSPSKIEGILIGKPYFFHSKGLLLGLLVLPPAEAEYKNHLFWQVLEGVLQNHLLKTVNSSAKVEIIGTYSFV